jgi:glycerophosphoryl diester phosphodiesterase
MKRAMLVAVLLIALSSNIVAQPLSGLPAARHAIIVIAHRGDHVEVPENTLAAYEKAIRHGADYVEIDLRTTKDGKLVIMHDASVDRMTNGKGKVQDLEYAAIRQLKITDKSKPGSATYSIPAFREVLNLCKGRIGIYLDFKEADPALAWRQIKEAGMEKNIVVYLNKEEQYGQWKKAAPQMPLMGSLPDTARNSVSMEHFLDKFSLSVLDGSIEEYDAAMLSAAAKRGVAVWLDTQSPDEGPAVWDKLLDSGIKGMQIDHPEKLILYLKEKRLR